MTDATDPFLQYEQPPSPSQEPERRGSSRWKWIGIVLFGFLAFFIFLILKLPEARIQNLVLAHAQIIAQQQGLLFSAEKVKTGILLGPSLKLYNVELKSSEDEKQVLKMPYLRIRPDLLSMVLKTKKASISAELLDGEITGSVGASPTNIVADLDVDTVNVGAATILRKFIPLELSSGIVNGKIKLDLDQAQTQKSDGHIDVTIDKLAAPAQSLYGFNLPKLNIGKTKIEITIAQGQIAIRAFEVGNDPKTDDIVARVTGGGTLDRVLERSRINAKATFRFSSAVTQSFPLLDALLGPAKTPDGGFAYRFSGPLISLEAQPGQ